MVKINTPIVHEIKFNQESLREFRTMTKQENNNKSEILLEYPTVYIVNDQTNREKYSVYIGETSDIYSRTNQHLSLDSSLNRNWDTLSESNTSKMFVIGHEFFNKSLTLDIENKLMHYLSSIDNVERVYNRRTNQQNKYYTSEYFEEIFSKVWRQLRAKNKTLFPLERVIKDSALFKASPFHKLTEEQITAKENIKQKILKVLTNDEKNKLFWVTGKAGSGKTVLMSSLFYEINKLNEEFPEDNLDKITTHLLVNHDQQLTVYDQIATKLGLKENKNSTIVGKPTNFINNHSPDELVDVVIVDEAHLLWTQGKQSYRGNNQLDDLIERARVVVAVFDANQVLTTEQYWENSALQDIQDYATKNGEIIELKNQMRIDADKETVDWIQSIIEEKELSNIPEDQSGYEIKVFEDAKSLHDAIKRQNENQDYGLSRLVATFDWEYVQARSPEDKPYWMVEAGNLTIPWNLQLDYDKRANKGRAWAEQEHTINEAGSTYTIQGFDLNYVGVIIGPSVKYRNGQIIFDGDASKNNKATRNRTLSDGTKQKFPEELLKNELNVLLTRGVRGLYLYAVDEELQEALLKAQKGELNDL